MRRARAILFFVLAACGGSSRFALRAPVWRDSDDRPLARAPAKDEESDYANTIDVTLLRPLSHAFLFEHGGESRNVNSLDEVPDSSWFTNRRPTAAEIERGPCPTDGPALPFVVKSSKLGGTTPGFVAVDARGQKYVVKLDELAHFGQPEMSTAADAIVSRLYWALGYNAPCNDVLYVTADDLRVGPGATQTADTGRKKPLTNEMVKSGLAQATRNDEGAYRVSASRFIDGQGVGTWRTEGTRSDDPNDVIPHEDRRDLRGEYFLAAWVKHWDSRGPNSFDTFVPSSRGGGGGYVLHYFLDFSDSLGGTTVRTEWREPRLGFESVFDLSTIVGDMLTFGVVRHAWDDIAVDWMYPNLGTLDVEHFDPMGFAPQTPLVRWQRAQPADLAWMARRIARIDRERLRAAVRAGKLSRPLEEARLVEVLWGRREKILRASFARSSPLAEVSVSDGDRVCAVDLGVETGISRAVGYDATFRGQPLAVTREPARLCVRLPHFAPARARDDSPERYATLDLVRAEGASKTTLRAHFYDLGPTRGYFLAGLERL